MATLLKVLNNLADIKSAGGCCTSRQNSGKATSATLPWILLISPFTRSMDQLFAQILVAAFADSEQLRLAAAISPRGSAWFPVSSPPQRSVDRVPPIARERPHALFRQ